VHHRYFPRRSLGLALNIHHPEKMTRLPLELIVAIGEILSGDGCLRTLASLNVTSRTLHEETQSALYETVTLPYSAVLGDILSGTNQGTQDVLFGMRYVK
jgi:hypothetical protein